MGNARAAKALRHAMLEPELDAKVAMLAIELGMLVCYCHCNQCEHGQIVFLKNSHFIIYLISYELERVCLWFHVNNKAQTAIRGCSSYT